MEAALSGHLSGIRLLRLLWVFHAVVQHRRRGDAGVHGRHLFEKAIADFRGVNLGKLAVLGRGFLRRQIVFAVPEPVEAGPLQDDRGLGRRRLGRVADDAVLKGFLGGNALAGCRKRDGKAQDQNR